MKTKTHLITVTGNHIIKILYRKNHQFRSWLRLEDLLRAVLNQYLILVQGPLRRITMNMGATHHVLVCLNHRMAHCIHHTMYIPLIHIQDITRTQCMPCLNSQVLEKWVYGLVLLVLTDILLSLQATDTAMNTNKKCINTLLNRVAV